ncbi:MAG: formiminotransferase-cyclodeaminase [Planctomycetota bacterium]|nr:MAG: formiminotransferase-cyclodeaminase [Planctomycetota bacterium]
MAFRTLTVEEFAEMLAAKTPAPGGGAVAAITAAHAAALGSMVLEFTIGKPKFAADDASNGSALKRLTELRHHALVLADRDAEAYGVLNSLWKLPKDAAERLNGWDAAVAAAIDAPQAILDAAAEIAATCSGIAARTNPNLASDLAIAIDLACVAARAAAHNVEVNLPSVTDEGDRNTRRAAMTRALSESAAAGARKA